jgi:hypothetical protein
VSSDFISSEHWLMLADSASVSYVAEHQENLQVVQVMLHGMGVSLEEDLVLQTPSSASGSVNEAIFSRKDSVLRIPLPTAVHAGQSITLSAQDLHYEARLSALPTPTSSVASLNTVLATALSASELRLRSPSALCCTACEREIADVSVASRSGQTGTGMGAGYKDLPSEHWAEMMEVWMCHSDPAFTSQLAKRTEEGFWPAQGGVLVGGSYVLVNKEDVKWSSLHFEDIRVSRLIHSPASKDVAHTITCHPLNIPWDESLSKSHSSRPTKKAVATHLLAAPHHRSRHKLRMGWESSRKSSLPISGGLLGSAWGTRTISSSFG